MTAISQRELRNDSGGVLRRVAAGETFTVTRRGVPVADLVPHRAGGDGPSRYVPAERITQHLSDVAPWDVQAFDKDLVELDARVDDEPSDPWPAQ